MSTRRDFLKQAGLLGTALAMPRTLLAARTDDISPAESAEAAKKLSYTISMSKESREFVPPKRKITIPDVGEFKVLKGDFHIHTIFSDGIVWPAQRVTEASGNGLDVIAITDHIEYRPHIGGAGLKLRDLNDEHNISYDYAKSTAEKESILLIRGTEITKSTMPPGHFNALFVDDVNPIAAVRSDIRKMFEETKKQGGFLLWNHPGWQAPKSGGIEPGAPITFTEMHKDFYKNGWLDGIETFNGSEFYPIVPDWVEEKDLAIFANSDIHRPELDTYGPRSPVRPITLVLAKERTIESIKEAFFAKRTIAWVANRIIGRPEIVSQLFRACIDTDKERNKILFVNKSDIRIEISNGSEKIVIPPMGKGEITANVDTYKIINWYTGMDKVLEVNL